MSGTWWVGRGDLDKDQRAIISLPLDGNVFITGPPGSGKTNLLLLRANHLFLAEYPNIAIVTFTRSLREFIASGAHHYDFPPSKIMTCREWQKDLLRQYGWPIPATIGDFDTDRESFLQATSALVKKTQLSDIYDAILLDEAQDYSIAELGVFASLTDRIFCVADERQKIYNGEDSIEFIKSVAGEPHVLNLHYRNGINICRVADEIAKKWHGYANLAITSNYDEKSNPSTVDCTQCASVGDQIELILSRIGTQLIAFPNQYIGVLSPTQTSRDTIWEAISASEHSDAAFILRGSPTDSFPVDKRIVVSTFHAAKGLEFGALHLAACDELKSFGNNRRLVFTAVTRAKTALSVYYMGSLHGYFDAALRQLQPITKPLTIDDIFGGRK